MPKKPELHIATPPTKGVIPAWAILSAHMVLIAILATSFLTGAHISPINGDLRGYADIANAMITVGKGTWISFYSFYFYPPLANIVFLIAKYNTFTVLPYDWGLLITNIFCAFAGILFILDHLKRADLRWLFLSILITIVLLEPSIFFARYDFFPTLALLLTALCIRQEKFLSAGLMLGAAFMLKFAPIFLLPLGFALIPRKKWGRFLSGFFSVCIVTWILYDLLLGWGATLDVFQGFFHFRSEQLIYIFSTTGSIDFFVKKLLGSQATVVWLDPNLGHFVDDFPSFMPLLQQGWTVLGCAIIALHAYRNEQRRDDILLYFGASVLWILFSTSFCNNHYYLWGLPFVFLWCLEQAEDGKRSTFLMGIMAVTAGMIALLGQYSFPYGYYELIWDQSWLAVTANLFRNLLVFGLVISCMYSTQSSPRDT